LQGGGADKHRGREHRNPFHDVSSLSAFGCAATYHHRAMRKRISMLQLRRPDVCRPALRAWNKES
jgi:hypothetical protein